MLPSKDYVERSQGDKQRGNLAKGLFDAFRTIPKPIDCEICNVQQRVRPSVGQTFSPARLAARSRHRRPAAGREKGRLFLATHAEALRQLLGPPKNFSW